LAAFARTSLDSFRVLDLSQHLNKQAYRTVLDALDYGLYLIPTWPRHDWRWLMQVHFAARALRIQDCPVPIPKSAPQQTGDGSVTRQLCALLLSAGSTAFVRTVEQVHNSDKGYRSIFRSCLFENIAAERYSRPWICASAGRLWLGPLSLAKQAASNRRQTWEEWQPSRGEIKGGRGRRRSASQRRITGEVAVVQSHGKNQKRSDSQGIRAPAGCRIGKKSC
jgi:hypothetical protein